MLQIFRLRWSIMWRHIIAVALLSAWTVWGCFCLRPGRYGLHDCSRDDLHTGCTAGTCCWQQAPKSKLVISVRLSFPNIWLCFWFSEISFFNYTQHLLQHYLLYTNLYNVLSLIAPRAHSGTNPNPFSLAEVCENTVQLCETGAGVQNEYVMCYQLFYESLFICLTFTEIKNRSVSKGVWGGRMGSCSSGEGWSCTASSGWFSNYWLSFNAGMRSKVSDSSGACVIPTSKSAYIQKVRVQVVLLKLYICLFY